MPPGSRFSSDTRVHLQGPSPRGATGNVLYLPLPSRAPQSVACSSDRGQRSGRRWFLCRPDGERKGLRVSFTVQSTPPSATLLKSSDLSLTSIGVQLVDVPPVFHNFHKKQQCCGSSPRERLQTNRFHARMRSPHKTGCHDA